MAFDFKKLSNREKNLVGVLLIVFSLLPFFCLTAPSWNTYAESAAKITQGTNRLKELDENVRKLETYKKENIELLKKLDTQKLYLAKSYEIDFLVQDLKKICDESSVDLQSFIPSGPEPVNVILEKQIEKETQGGDYNPNKIRQVFEKLKTKDMPVDVYRYPIEVKVTGDFTDILELFSKLEKYGRVISVENISIGKIQSKQNLGDRLSKSKQLKKTTEDGYLLGTFNLVAYSLAKEGEILPFSDLQGSAKSTFKFKRKRR